MKIRKVFNNIHFALLLEQICDAFQVQIPIDTVVSKEKMGFLQAKCEEHFFLGRKRKIRMPFLLKIYLKRTFKKLLFQDELDWVGVGGGWSALPWRVGPLKGQALETIREKKKKKLLFLYIHTTFAL